MYRCIVLTHFEKKKMKLRHPFLSRKSELTLKASNPFEKISHFGILILVSEKLHYIHTCKYEDRRGIADERLI